MSDTKTGLEKEIKDLADYLNQIANGMIKSCYACKHKMVDVDTNHCCECNSIVNIYDMTDFIYSSDIYDMEYIAGMSGEYKAVKLWIALGSPTVWIDTVAEAVKGVCGSDEAYAGLSKKTVKAIDYVAENMYSELRRSA